MRRLSHTQPEPKAPETVGAAIERCARALARARVHFGHGTDNARDEAAELVFYAARLPHEKGSAVYGKLLTPRQRVLIEALLAKRIKQRVPLAYLTRRAFFAGLELYVDERVIVPRSPIAELIAARFAPWIASRGVRRILDMGYWIGRDRAGVRRGFSARARRRGRHLPGGSRRHAGATCAASNSRIESGFCDPIISPPCRRAVTISS